MNVYNFMALRRPAWTHRSSWLIFLDAIPASRRLMGAVTALRLMFPDTLATYR